MEGNREDRRQKRVKSDVRRGQKLLGVHRSQNESLRALVQAEAAAEPPALSYWDSHSCPVLQNPVRQVS